MTRPIFKHFRFAGKSFLLIPWPGGDVAVVSEDGENFGTYRDFKCYLKMRDAGTVTEPVGMCNLSIWHTPEPIRLEAHP